MPNKWIKKYTVLTLQVDNRGGLTLTFSKFTSIQNAFSPQQITPSISSLCWPFSCCWGGQQRWQLPGRQQTLGATWNPEVYGTGRQWVYIEIYRSLWNTIQWQELKNQCLRAPMMLRLVQSLRFQSVSCLWENSTYTLLAALLKPDHPRLDWSSWSLATWRSQLGLCPSWPCPNALFDASFWLASLLWCLGLKNELKPWWTPLFWDSKFWDSVSNQVAPCRLCLSAELFGIRPSWAPIADLSV